MKKTKAFQERRKELFERGEREKLYKIDSQINGRKRLDEKNKICLKGK